jgi:hypothetical protein
VTGWERRSYCFSRIYTPLQLIPGLLFGATWLGAPAVSAQNPVVAPPSPSQSPLEVRELDGGSTRATAEHDHEAAAGTPGVTETAKPPAHHTSEAPLAGIHDGKPYLRDANDRVQLFPLALLLLDGHAWAGPGVREQTGSDLVPRLWVRAARLGAAASLYDRLAFKVVVAAGGQSVGNYDGTEMRSAAPPGVEPTAETAQYESAQTASNRARLLDAWLNLELGPSWNVMIGQYRVPFTLGNATSLTKLPFHERSFVARLHPLRDIGATAWGESDRTGLAYYVGLFQGDGANRPGIDARGDLMGRVTWQPWHGQRSPLESLRVGISGRIG